MMVVLLLVAFYSFVWVELLSNCQSGECTPATALSGAGGLWEIVFVRLMNSTISASAVGSLLKSNESRSVASAVTALLLIYKLRVVCWWDCVDVANLEFCVLPISGSVIRSSKSLLECQNLLGLCSRRFWKIETWLILPVVICLSQRLSHACLSISNIIAKLRMAH